MHGLLQQAVELLVERFASSMLAPLSMCACMACVRLPDGLQAATRSESVLRDVDAKSIQVLHACIPDYRISPLYHACRGRQLLQGME